MISDIDYIIKHLFDIKYKFKMVELEGCSACIDAKKLLKDKKIEPLIIEIKDLNQDEKGKLGDYKWFPKIFMYNEITGLYDFLGGRDKLYKHFNL